MIVDTSAVLAILRAEPEAEQMARALEQAETRRMSAANYLEAAIVIDLSRSPIGSRRMDDLFQLADITIEPVTLDQVQVGRLAYRDYGKGTGHPAQLNFGDCFAYALARTTGEALLFKGRDFIHTDITPALA